MTCDTYTDIVRKQKGFKQNMGEGVCVKECPDSAIHRRGGGGGDALNNVF